MWAGALFREAGDEPVVGAAWRFTCPGCGYDAVVAGGRGALFAGPTMTISCKECRELSDVVCWNAEDLVAVREGARWSVASPHPEATSRTTPACDVDESHAVAEWVEPGACPKCGATMARDEDSMILAD